jgi:hypothetical protein
MESIDFDIENYEKKYDKANKYKNMHCQDDTKWVNVSIDDINESDIIYVEYIPMSQKYLYVHSPECGIVEKMFYVQNDYDNYQKVQKHLTIKNPDGESILINKDHLSIYSEGYIMLIKKLVG